MKLPVKVNYWVYPGILYRIHDPVSAMVAVTKIFNQDEEAIKSSRRHRPISEARAAYCYIMMRKLKFGPSYTCKFINRHHATAIHNANMAEILIEQDKKFRKKIALLEGNIDTKKKYNRKNSEKFMKAYERRLFNIL